LSTMPYKSIYDLEIVSSMYIDMDVRLHVK
jgi:hypothetical protein